MLRRSGRCRPGFSLVEVVIVIAIIAIVAAIALPRFRETSRAARESALRHDLAALRTAIERYAAEHHGVFPGAQTAGEDFGSAGTEDALKSQLLLASDADGRCAPARDSAHPLGPYLRTGFPPLPVGVNRGSDRVNVSNTAPLVAPDDGVGWVYSYVTGDIIANSDDLDSVGKQRYEEY